MIGGGSPRRERVALIGLDACDPLTVRRMAAAGALPHIARFMAGAARCRIGNPYGLFVGSAWANFMTGVGPGRHGFYCWDMIDPDSYAYRMKAPGLAHPSFWDTVGEAGRRVAILDVPHSRIAAPLNGVGIAEYGCHDRHYGLHAEPPGRVAEIAGRFGLHPVFGLDPYKARDFAPDDVLHRSARRRTPAENKALLDGLLAGARAKTRLAAALLEEEDWKLFVAVFGESHAAGHQFWYLHDARHPRFDPAEQAALGGDPVAAVYRALDAAVGELTARLGPDATVLLLFSHGMAQHHDGTHLLAEILRRLDHDYRGTGGGPRDLAKRASQALLPAADRLARRLRVPAALREAMAHKLGARFAGAARERARQAFFFAPNNHVYGGIRFNLAGREAAGWVTADEREALTRALEVDLRALVNAETGGRVVRSVRRTERFHARAPGDSMPDLLIDWERSAPIEVVSSPRIGTVRAPYDWWRTGDHRLRGMLLARGPGLAAGSRPKLAMEDLPVSIAARLGVALPGADGEAVPWLVGDAVQAPLVPVPASQA